MFQNIYMSGSTLDFVNLLKDKSFFWSALLKLDSIDNVNTTISPLCYQSIQLIINKFQQADPIGLKMIDSSASFPNGFLDGTLVDFGDFDECLSLKFPLPLRVLGNSTHEHQMTGKHCMVKVHPILDVKQYKALENSWMVKNDFPLNIGICIPSSCSTNEIQLLLSKALYSSYRIIEKPYCDEPFESSKFLNSLTTGQLISISYILAMVIMVLVASLYDFYLRFSKRKVNKIASSLSAISALLDLLSADNERFKTRKKSIDLMRFVWVVIIITAHAAFCGIEPRVIYKVARLDVDLPLFFERFHNQPLFNAAVIEGFFYIGGFVTYVSLHTMLFKGTASLGSFAINRWMRYMPGMISIMAVEQVWPLLTNGPMAAEVRDNIYKNCAKNWWKNIFFINNFDGLVNMCLTHTWYVSADIQLFLIGLAVMAILRFNRAIGVSLMYFLVILGMMLTGLTAYFENHIPAIILANKDWWGFLDFIDYSYLPTTPHLTPYFMGILVGYYFKNDSKLLNKTIEKILWLFCPIVFIVITFMPALWNTFKWEPQKYYSAAIYLTFYRFLWTFAFAWGISILTKYVIKVVKFMKEASGMSKYPTGNPASSPSSFHVTSLILGVARMYFSIYLVHSIYVRWYWTSSRQLFVYDAFNIGERTVLMVGMSIITAFFFYVLFECPFENLRTSIFKKTIE
uniref:Nose resistant-to-fluoxetine protein N-terminal domain-containing protein n=1 Tax=Tetranychus urticae TaxID=32264 RepID=T1K018_TETUR